jgi:hypothetical protein
MLHLEQVVAVRDGNRDAPRLRTAWQAAAGFGGDSSREEQIKHT